VAGITINWELVGSGPKNGWEGYAEIVVKGTQSQPVPVLTADITPQTASDVVGGSITMYATFTGATSYQWQKNGTNILGATASSLTLNNLSLSDTATNGGYSLVASNSSGAASSGACAVTVRPAPVADNNAVVSIATQTKAGDTFTPTWDATSLTSSLLYYSAFLNSSGFGDFTASFQSTAGGGISVLTDGQIGPMDYVQTGTHYLFACAGSLVDGSTSVGNYARYDLFGSATGYTLTNLTTFSGWNDGGRDAQNFVVYVATVAHPDTYYPLAQVNYNPTNPVGYSAVRSILTPASGSLASNVVSVLFSFMTTNGTSENGYCGYSEAAMFGTPSGPDTEKIAISASSEEVPVGSAPSWTAAGPSLIANQVPSAVGGGNFGAETSMGVAALTDGVVGDITNHANFATCGANAGTSMTYTCTNGTWNLTNIVVYSGWGNRDRDGQFYTISYATPSAPSTFVPLTTVFYNPTQLTTNPYACRVQISPANGASMLATNVQSLKLDFTSQNGNKVFDYGYSGYAEIVLQGTNLASTVVVPPTVNPPVSAGGNLILTGTGGTPGASYTWLTSTNVTAPINTWTTNTVGTLNGSGGFSNAIPINAAEPTRFFRLRLP
jgi:hypothetical protein